MVEGLIGIKLGMSRGADAEGNLYAVTVLKAGPCTVIQKKGPSPAGRQAVQLGLVEDRAVRKPNKAQTGHFAKAGVPVVRVLREFRHDGDAELKEGDQVLVDIFQPGDVVDVIGTSKGKGFQGVIKRHGFAGGKASHGSMFHRRPGSIGASSFPSRVIKGQKMPGHMGHVRVTAKNLQVMEADRENHLLVVRGAVPGPRGGYVVIKKRASHG
ncbi:MAG: 50S ribosomal protein L3 [Candidatus Aminicenantes bacterium RBG_13_62_12]|nr:MAG: 50S ribosomal protein L3 [Candidatus Aminicenantes bacterium RBG_13_62_12]